MHNERKNENSQNGNRKYKKESNRKSCIENIITKM